MNQDFDRDPNCNERRAPGNSTAEACGNWEPLLILFAAGGELDPADQARFSAHLNDCAACSGALAQEQELLEILSSHRNDPDASDLTRCRASLQDALDREEERSWVRRIMGMLLPGSWLAPRPAWSAGLLLLIGFSLGVFGPRLFHHWATNPSTTAANAGSDAENSPANLASTPFDAGSTPLDLHSADVAGMNVFPSGNAGPARVELQLKQQQPVTVQGTVDDDDVKAVLLGILNHSDRFCADMRLDAVECLRARNNDPDVRAALCNAVRTDKNAAVRLKALAALDGSEPQDVVRQTLLDALVDDQNPGVRIEAVNALRDMAEKGQVNSDPHALAVLRDRMKKDPNTYIRLQSAAAISDIGPREKF
jgi:HEAT repeats/Putative zinc-finger